MKTPRLHPIRVLLLIAGLIALAFPCAASAASGDLVFGGCLTGNTAIGPSGSGACAALSTAGNVGAASGMNGAKSVATSSDGKSVYVASSIDDAISIFTRDTSTGFLAPQGCITGQ